MTVTVTVTVTVTMTVTVTQLLLSTRRALWSLLVVVVVAHGCSP